MPRAGDVQVRTSTFYSLFNQENKLSLPLFQRDYTWEQENLTKFWDDIQKTIVLQGKEHFIGQIVLGEEKELLAKTNNPILKNFYNIIDGQQRVTTSTIFLCALRDEALNNKNDATATEIHRYVTLSPGYMVPDGDFILALSYSDKKFFKNFIQIKYGDATRKSEQDYERMKTSGEIKSSNELLYDAYKFFQNKIKNEVSNYNDIQKANYYVRLKDCLLRNFFFIEVKLPNLVEGSQIFETMNAWGERLEAIDLVKNLVFMNRQKQGISQSQ